MLHEKPGRSCPLGSAGDDGDGTRAWMGEKRLKYLGPSLHRDSSEISYAGKTTTVPQDHEEYPKEILHVTDMDIIQRQDELLRASGEDISQHKDGQEEFWGPGVDISSDEFLGYFEYLSHNIPEIDIYSKLHGAELREVNERLARYRIRFYKMSKPECGDKLKDPTEYSSAELEKERYFVDLEKDDSFEWYFHPEHSRIADLDDYQRLDLFNYVHDRCEYQRRDDYHSCFNTYEVDDDYVNYCGELSKKIKWIESYLELDWMSPEFMKMDSIAWSQALKIAAGFPHMNIDLAQNAYLEYLSNLCEIAGLKDLDLVFFEIWKRVAKQRRDFRDALEEIYQMGKFHLHKPVMEAELKGRVYFKMEHRFDTCVEDIPENAEEDEAQDLITRAVYNKLRKSKTMEKYAAKKMDVAKRIGIIQPA